MERKAEKKYYLIDNKIVLRFFLEVQVLSWAPFNYLNSIENLNILLSVRIALRHKNQLRDHFGTQHFKFAIYLRR